MKKKKTISTRKSKRSATTGPKRWWVAFVSNPGYAASLERCKIYASIPDARAEAKGLLRVIDESGEDYRFPRRWFRPIQVDEGTTRALRSKSTSR